MLLTQVYASERLVVKLASLALTVHRMDNVTLQIKHLPVDNITHP